MLTVIFEGPSLYSKGHAERWAVAEHWHGDPAAHLLLDPLHRGALTCTTQRRPEVLRLVAFLLRRQGNEAVVAHVKTMGYEEWARLRRSADLPTQEPLKEKVCGSCGGVYRAGQGRRGAGHRELGEASLPRQPHQAGEKIRLLASCL